MRALAIPIGLTILSSCVSFGCGGRSTPPTAAATPPTSGTAGESSELAVVDSPGELPMSEVEAHMDDVRAAIRRCAAVTTFEGIVAVRVTIEATGAASARIEQGSHVQAIDDCVTGAFAQVTFPRSEHGQRFRYSFKF